MHQAGWEVLSPGWGGSGLPQLQHRLRSEEPPAHLCTDTPTAPSGRDSGAFDPKLREGDSLGTTVNAMVKPLCCRVSPFSGAGGFFCAETKSRAEVPLLFQCVGFNWVQKLLSNLLGSAAATKLEPTSALTDPQPHPWALRG